MSNDIQLSHRLRISRIDLLRNLVRVRHRNYAGLSRERNPIPALDGGLLETALAAVDHVTGSRCVRFRVRVRVRVVTCDQVTRG